MKLPSMQHKEEDPMSEENTRSYHTMHDLPPGEQPRERLRDLGPRALSDTELLAILLRTGQPGVTALDLARDLLVRYEGLSGLLRASFDQLCQEHGMGPAKTAQVKAALEIGQRLLPAASGEVMEKLDHATIEIIMDINVEIGCALHQGQPVEDKLQHLVNMAYNARRWGDPSQDLERELAALGAFLTLPQPDIKPKMPAFAKRRTP